MSEVVSCGAPPLDFDLVTAWLDALGATDVNVLQRRLSWDNASLDNITSYITSLLPCHDSPSFDALQASLRSSAPIIPVETELHHSTVPFGELWHRVSLGAVELLATSLSEDVSMFYQVRASMWGDYKGVRDDLASALTDRLSTIGQLVLWEEFNKRRTADQVILAHLAQDGSRHRRPKRDVYCAFLEALRSDGLAALTARYPALTRHLSTAVRNWTHGACELLTRVYEDRPLLSEQLGVPRDARLVGVTQSLGDAHRSGRSVSLLKFSSDATSDNPSLIVYKPRDVNLDHAFQCLISQVPTPRPDDDPLHSLTVVRRDGYGYMEYAPHHVCTDDQELRRFYRNAGRLTAILYLLGCSDCHYENLIARRDQLLLVDAETLFEGIPIDSAAFGVSKLQRDIAASVLKVGILPHWEIIGVDQMPIDASALGIQPPEHEHRLVAGWIGLNSDGMFLGSATQHVVLPTSLPVGFGSPNRLHEFVDDYCDGFQNQLSGIAAEKWTWIGGNGVLDRFKTLTRRHVHRPTWLYFSLQHQLLEPTSVRSEINQRLTLERLARRYLRSDTKPADWVLFAAEVSAMSDLDIPFFEQSTDDLGLSSWNTGRLLERSGYETAYRKIEQLDSDQINFQMTLIRGAIAAKKIGRDHGIQPAGRRPDPAWIEVSIAAEERFREVCNIGHVLVSSSITDGSDAVEWLGIHLAEDVENSIYGPLGMSLYDGKTGIALFLAAVAQMGRTNEDICRRTAWRACSELRGLIVMSKQNELVEFWRDQPLGLAGSGGVLLALLHLQTLLPELRNAIGEEMSVLLDSLEIARIGADTELDVMKGCAGLIGPLLRIDSPRSRLLAEEAGNHLLNSQDRSGGWLLKKMSSKALTGFSHGASGMAAALARLHSATNHRKYRESAERALEYERAEFSREHLNWPDYRGVQGSGPPRFMLSWCHGAPGVALSRLCMVNTSLWNESVKGDLLCAAETTAKLGADGDSLCCGRFGRSAILRLAARDCNEESWLRAAIQLENQGLAMKRANGGYGFSEMLGLFRGASGVGLALLESIAGEAYELLPSILSAGLYGNPSGKAA
jgi:type 2 lantibiotic biosynthesis protein LanM